MAPTRKIAPLEIYQDTTADLDPAFFHHKPQYHAPGNARPNAASTQNVRKRPAQSQGTSLANVMSFENSHHTVRFNIPEDDFPFPSPLKHMASQSHDMGHLSQQDIFSNTFLPHQAPYLTTTDALPKKQIYGRYQPVAPKLPPQALFNTFTTAKSQEKENDRPLKLYSEPSSEPGYDLARYTSANHSLADAIAGRNGKRHRAHSEDVAFIPEPEDMPAIHDEDNGAKPPYSYSQLIGMAILRAPGRRLTLSSIYKWISDTFEFYRNAEAGWMNSIRHNLSLSKSFYKQERPKDDPGKGNYWCITEDDQKNFVRDKKAPKPLAENPSYFSRSEQPPAYPDHFVVPPKPARAIDSSKFPPAADNSSDGTLPESDPVLEEKQAGQTVVEPSAFALPSSPPPLNIASSPPVARHTPPPPSIFPSNSRSARQGQRRRKTVDSTFRDSGFFSSINSSITRPGAVGALIAGDPSRRSLKRGRAEEEIARMRGSSFDPSPSRINKVLLKPVEPPTSNFGSSPSRFDFGSGSTPLTPGIKLKAPTRAPPTVSPNTHLQRHRERVRALMGTPANVMKPARGLSPNSLTHQSPIFLLPSDLDRKTNSSEPRGDQSSVGFGDLGNLSAFESRRVSLDEEDLKIDFDTIPDFGDIFTPEVSPLKARFSEASAQLGRPALQRAVTASGALADITRSHTNRLASPFNFEKRKRSPVNSASPSKKRKTGFVVDEDPFWAQNIFVSSDDEKENDDQEEHAGFDLLKDFSRGGENKENAHTSGLGAKRSSGGGFESAARPILGRSATNVL